MKLRWATALLALAALNTAGARAAGFGFTVSSATVVNNDANNNGKADVGETFTVTNAKFSSYVSSGGAPKIADGDLDRYSADIHGTVVAVNGNEVRYTGPFSITYTGPAYPLGLVIETGQTEFWATFQPDGSAILRGNFKAKPGNEPGMDSDPNFRDTDFEPYNPGRFFGLYTPTPGNPATGTISANMNAGPEGFAASLHNATLTNNDANSNGMADVGETFTMTAPIAAYYPQTADALLPLRDADLSRYQLVLNGTVVSVVGRSVDYTGAYSLRYTGPAYPAGVEVETGTFSLNALFNESGTGAAKLSGQFVATVGVPAGLASDPNFSNTDFAIFNPATFNGTYEPASPGALSGSVSGNLTGGVLGFSATVGNGVLTNNDTNNNGVADVGETFVATGPLSAYMAVGAPPLLDKDLNRYTITLNGTVATVVGQVVTYTGTFRLTYSGPSLTADIETGVFDLRAVFAADGTAHLAGSLTADVGAPAGGPFASTDYAPFNDAAIEGFYRSSGATGSFFARITSGTMVQSIASRKLGAAIEGSPTAATSTTDARRAVVAAGNMLYVLDPATGYDAAGWENGKVLDGKVVGNNRPVVLRDQVFVGTDTGMLYRFDLNTGALLSSGRPGGAGSSILTAPAPVAAAPMDQVVVSVANWNGGTASAIVRLAADNLTAPVAGPQVLSPAGLATSSPAIPLNGNVYVGTSDGLFLLNYADLTIKAQSPVSVFTSPLVAESTVWVGTGDATQLQALNANNLSALEGTTYNLNSPLQLGAFYDSVNGYVYAGTYDGRVHAFNTAGAYAGLVLPGLFNPENTGNSMSMPVAAGRLMFRATNNKQVLFGIPLNGDAQGAVDVVSPVAGAMAATGQTAGADFVISASGDGFIHMMSLPGVSVP